MSVVLEGYDMKDMPNANVVWGTFLKEQGWERHAVPNTCPDCYTVKDFASDHPVGTYIVATAGHVLCVKDGDWIDTWQSGDETVLYFFEKGE